MPGNTSVHDHAGNTAPSMNSDLDDLKAAYNKIGEALNTFSLCDHEDQWNRLQQEYFDMKAKIRAHDPDFQEIGLDGTRVHVPSTPRLVEPNPTIEDTGGEWEFPTQNTNFSVLDTITVCDPGNPHVTHNVSIDHVIDAETGDMHVEVNAMPLEKLP